MYVKSNPTSQRSRAHSRGSSSQSSSLTRLGGSPSWPIFGPGAGAAPARQLGDDSAILAQIFQGQSGAPASSLVQQTVQTAMAQGALWTKENCSGIPASSNILGSSLTVGGGVAIKIAGATGPAAPFVLAAGGIMELFGALFGSHAAKVKQEQQIICAVVAGCNDTFTSIDQLFQSGQISANQASQALDGMYSQLQQQVQPILKQDSGHCNAACFILAEARGVIAKRKLQYQAASQAAQPAPAQAPVPTSSGANPPSVGSPPQPAPGSIPGGTPSLAQMVANLATSTGIPSVAIWALGAVVLVNLIER